MYTRDLPRLAVGGDVDEVIASIRRGRGLDVHGGGDAGRRGMRLSRSQTSNDDGGELTGKGRRRPAFRNFLKRGEQLPRLLRRRDGHRAGRGRLVEEHCWTLARIAEVIRRKCGVSYTVAGVDLLAPDRLECEMPAHRATRRVVAPGAVCFCGDIPVCVTAPGTSVTPFFWHCLNRNLCFASFRPLVVLERHVPPRGQSLSPESDETRRASWYEN